MHIPHVKSIGSSRAASTEGSAGSDAAPVGIYVHFPWCLTKCPYCDFLSVPLAPRASGGETRALSGDDEREVRSKVPHRPYADAVLRELRARQDVLDGRRIQSVFFGGGTPSLWEPAELARVLEALQELAGGTLREVTVEGNPSSLDEREIEGLVAAGVQRFSIGIQSLDAARLAFLGRAHDTQESERALRAAVRSGRRVSADLIYGVHGQSPGAALEEVLEVLSLGPGHISAYSLTIEENTRFGNLHKRGRLPLLKDDLIAETYWLLHEALTRRGFEHYEISNYALPDQRSLHNEGYWQGNDYLGLGVGAVGTVSLRGSRLRYKNHISVERYLNAYGSSKPSAPFDEELHEREWLTPEISIGESILLGLRTKQGIDLDFEGERRGVDPWTPERKRAASKLAEQGLLVREGTRLSIPEAKWMLADRVIRELY